MNGTVGNSCSRKFLVPAFIQGREISRSINNDKVRRLFPWFENIV